jgi:hypothetical protein
MDLVDFVPIGASGAETRPPLSAFIEGRPYRLDAALFDPADAARLDRITESLLARRC